MFPNAFPQGDPFGMSQLLAQGAQNPDALIPLLVAAGIEPPSGGVETGAASPFAQEFPQTPQAPNPNAPRSIPGMDVPPPANAGMPVPPQPAPSAMLNEFPLVQEPPAPQPAAAPAPPQAQPSAVPAQNVMSDPNAPHNMLRKLFGAQPTGTPAPAPDMSSNYGSEFPLIPGSPPVPTGTPQGPSMAQGPQQPPTLGAANAPNLPAVQGVPDDLQILQRMEGGRGGYGTVVDAGKGRRALGAYGILDSNLPQWGPQYLGRNITPEEFLADRNAQDTIARGEFGRLKGLYGGEGAAQRWLTGEFGNPNATDRFGTSGVAHGQKYAQLAKAMTGAPAVGDMGQWADPTIAPTPQVAGGTGPAPTPVPGGLAPSTSLEVGSSSPKPGGQLAEAGKKASTLADALRGVKMPEAPQPQKVSTPSVPGPRAIDQNSALVALLTKMMSGQTQMPQSLRLNTALRT